MSQVSHKTSKKASSKWLIGLLLLTIAITVWMALKSEPDIETSVELSEHTMPKTRSELQLSGNKKMDLTPNDSSFIPWKKLTRKPSLYKSADLFKVHSWQIIVVPKKVKPLPPPPLVAPPAPFTYVGKLEDISNSTKIFLMANDKLYTITKGEKINQLWRLDAEDINTIKLTYLPLNLPQTLSKLAKPLTVPPPVVVTTGSDQ